MQPKFMWEELRDEELRDEELKAVVRAWAYITSKQENNTF